jgi:alpha-L-fucosidase 2
MMQHVFEHWGYSQDVERLKAQGYSMIKSVAEFLLSKMQEDAYTGDGTLVVNSCNSPEHGPTIFGCAHDQKLIHQVFDTGLSVNSVVEERDTAFLAESSKSLY